MKPSDDKDAQKLGAKSFAFRPLRFRAGRGARPHRR